MRHAAVAGAVAGAKEAVAGAGKAFPDMAGAAAIEGAEAGAKEGVKRFEPTISLFGGACILTAAFFVPPTAASGAEVVVGLLGSCFMCYGVIGKNALHAKDAAKDAAEAAAKDAAEAAAKDATKATPHDKQGWWAPRRIRLL